MEHNQIVSEFLESFNGSYEEGTHQETFSDSLKANLQAGITTLILEAKRDTRHACAKKAEGYVIYTMGESAHGNIIHSHMMNIRG